MISAIVACYKDEQAIPVMAQRLRATFERIDVEYEIIFVNDGSPDNSQNVLEDLARQDSRIKVITHTRNFGSQNAFSSGLARASGDACVLLDGDLQDPPELIADFFAKWSAGEADIVYGQRVRREMPRLWELGYKAFYRLFQKLAYIRVPVDAGDFSLLDRRVVDALQQLPERDRFLRGLRAWVGFRQMGIPYVRPERMFGRSTNNLWSNMRWARKGIFSFSYVPLEFISLGALAVSLLAIAAICFQVVDRILRPELPRGISYIIIVCLFLGSVQLLSLAFIAEYIGKIFEEVKQRPLYLVSKLINFESRVDDGRSVSEAPPSSSARA
jgi:polyisoprenyl-phosphate glycosyltransferase